MGYNTENTKWPAAALSDEAKTQIDKFFSLLDDPSDGVGNKLADEIFTTDGSLHGGGGTANGSAGTKAPSLPHIKSNMTSKADRTSQSPSPEIRKSRENAWKLIKVRHHVIQKVYAYDSDAADVMLIGTVEMVLQNDRKVKGEFTGQIVFDGSGDRTRIKVYQDSAPLLKALRGED
ncbi:hypothetical protein EDB81DRAFT_887701 [Dactylonectria macrodidyma]|uniref:Uncharacterized protein n=1 Tax=Dactylonectria macrodidyma TaxID=307937 RepID=A0A9P9IUG2_9HYPO|nr:hypothetical protein EDB81DRAFT_887701 [Dactylonectria macrodidyma]